MINNSRLFVLLSDLGSAGEVCDTEYEDIAQPRSGVDADQGLNMYRCCGKTFQVSICAVS